MASQQILPKEIKTVAPKANPNIKLNSVVSSDMFREDLFQMMGEESNLDSFLNSVSES
jgi:hypothetical protein